MVYTPFLFCIPPWPSVALLVDVFLQCISARTLICDAQLLNMTQQLCMTPACCWNSAQVGVPLYFRAERLQNSREKDQCYEKYVLHGRRLKLFTFVLEATVGILYWSNHRKHIPETNKT